MVRYCYYAEKNMLFYYIIGLINVSVNNKIIILHINACFTVADFPLININIIIVKK